MAPESQEVVVHDEEYVDAFYKFAMEYHVQDLAEILLKPDDDLHYAVHISFQELHGDERFEAMANLLCSKPRRLLPLFDEALRKAQVDIADVHELQEDMSFKPHVHARITLMECPEMKPSISRVRCEDIGRILAVRGTIIRTGAVKMLEGEREYECAKCKLRFKVTPQLEQDNKLTLPASCPSDRTKPCKSVTFNYVEESKICHDYQEIKIQEEMHGLGVGSVPRSIVAVLQDDLVDYCKAGDDVEVTGVLCCKWKPVMKGVRCDLEMVILANNIRKASADKAAVDLSPETVVRFEEYWRQYLDCPLKGRNGILKGICPQVYGLFTVKLAVALTLIGGVARVDKSGTRVRGEPHLLIVGDPGTGKSQFMKYAAKLSARSVVTTGMGSTGAGLTVTAVRDNGEWMLEAGALVLADGGLCCIDEFDGIREADRATIHEAMEQQTLSVAKAGLVTTLNTRCTVFAVCNPKGQYDPDNTLEVNTSLAAPLLSRFDIVLVLLDTKNPDWDRIVSTHILTEHKNAHRADEDVSPSSPTPSAFWTIDMLRSYIYYVKAAFQPTLTPEAERVIVNYYQLQRRSNAGNRNQARTTIRMLESLVRLAQAHARLMFRHEVLRTDAVVAVVTVESSMTTSAILENMTNALHSSFKDEPDAEYREIESQILTALAIPIPSEEERASERTRGRQGEAPRGDHEDALCGVQNVGEERCGEQETRLDEGRSEKNSGAEEMGLPHKRASDVLEPLGSPVGESDRHPDGRTEAEVGGISDKDALSDIGFAREEGTLRDEPGTDDAARWQAEARALDERLKGFRRAGVDVSATGEAAWAPESAAPSLRSLERGIQERVASSGNVAQEDRLLKSSRRCEHSKQEGDLLGTRLRAPGGDQGGLERAAEGPVESTDHLGACEGAGSRGPGIATGKERRRAEALKMLEDFDEELLQEFDFSGGSDSPVGTELPVCLSPLARKSSGSQSPLSSGHVASGGGANVVAGGRTRGSTGPSSADVASRKGGHVARGGSTGNCQSESVGKVEAQEGTRIDSGQYAVTSDGANARSDKHLDSPNWTAQQEGDGASRIPEDGSSSLPHDCAPGARPSSAAHQGSAQETSDLIRTLTQRLARPPRIVQTELPNDLGSSAPEERQPQDTPRVSRLDGYETQLRVAPLADRAVNEINRIPDQAAGLGIIRKRLLERRSADESEDPNWVSDEQWGLRSPKKRARDC